MNMIVDRKEDMSPEGYLRLIQQEDGDIILGVFEDDGDGKIIAHASVEFCTCVMGGGLSKLTLKALRNLAKAMAMDNKDGSHKTGEFKGEIFLDDNSNS